MDAVHSSGPIGCREQPDISLVHVQAGEPSGVSALSQDLATVSVPLNGAHGDVADNSVGQQSPSGASEQVEGSLPIH